MTTTTTTPDITATTYTQSTVEPSTFMPNDSITADASDSPVQSVSSTTSANLSVTIRQLPENVFLPLLLLLQYLSTAWITELVATSFANESIHQKAVSDL